MVYPIEHLQTHLTTLSHSTTKSIDIDRTTQNIQGYNITLTTSQVQEAIKQSKNNNSQTGTKHNISVHKPLQIIKALTATGWVNRRRHSLMATYKAVMRQVL